MRLFILSVIAVIVSALAAGGVYTVSQRSVDLQNQLNATQRQQSDQLQELRNALENEQSQAQTYENAVAEQEEVIQEQREQMQVLAERQQQSIQAVQQSVVDSVASIASESVETQAVIAEAMTDMNTAVSTLASVQQELIADQAARSERQFDRFGDDIEDVDDDVGDLQTDLAMFEGETNVAMVELSSSTQAQIDAFVTIPVGAFVCWTGDQIGQAVPKGWVLMNGQTLSDTDSIWDGEVIPDYNGLALFTRGGAASGVIQDDTTAVNGLTGTFARTPITAAESAGGTSYFRGDSTVNNLVTASVNLSGDSETRPDNVSCRYILRVK